MSSLKPAMIPMAEPRPGRRSNAAERILQGAVDRLVITGAVELSMQDVADAAGVSKALIHYHYHDKESLLAQVAFWTTTQLVGREAVALEGAMASTAMDLLWRWLDEELDRGHLRLLIELGQYRASRVETAVQDSTRRRREAATASIRRLFELLDLHPRIPEELLAGVVVVFTDGLAGQARADDQSDARIKFDVFWLSLLSLAE